MDFAKGLKLSSLESYDRAARQGVPRGFVNDLAKKIDVGLGELAPTLHVSARTLSRYETDQLLPLDVSDRALSIARVYQRAVETFGTQELAVAWLKHPSECLGAIPLSLLNNIFGTERVLQGLESIKRGVFC